MLGGMGMERGGGRGVGMWRIEGGGGCRDSWRGWGGWEGGQGVEGGG